MENREGKYAFGKVSLRKILIFFFASFVINSIIVLSSAYFLNNSKILPLISNTSDVSEVRKAVQDHGFDFDRKIITTNKGYCQDDEKYNLLTGEKEIFTTNEKGVCTRMVLLKTKPVDLRNEIYVTLLMTVAICLLMIFGNKYYFLDVSVAKEYTNDELKDDLEKLKKYVIGRKSVLNKSDVIRVADEIFYRILEVTKRESGYHFYEYYDEILNSLSKSYFSDFYDIFFIQLKTVEKTFFLTRKQFGKYAMSLLNFISSLHYTSFRQLFFFFIAYLIINAIILQSIYHQNYINTNFYYYLGQTTAIASNLGSDLDLTKTIGETIFYVYLQISGLLIFGILIGIIQKDIKRN